MLVLSFRVQGLGLNRMIIVPIAQSQVEKKREIERETGMIKVFRV